MMKKDKLFYKEEFNLKKVLFSIILIILVAVILIFAWTNKHNDTNNTNTENKIENEINDNSINQTIQENTTIDENIALEDKNISIVKEISPAGFMGSSLYKVILYSDKNVYLQTYDGNGYEKSNVTSEKLIATGVDSIELGTGEDHYGEVIIKGGEAKNTETGWIIFE